MGGDAIDEIDVLQILEGLYKMVRFTYCIVYYPLNGDENP